MACFAIDGRYPTRRRINANFTDHALIVQMHHTVFIVRFEGGIVDQAELNAVSPVECTVRMQGTAGPEVPAVVITQAVGRVKLDMGPDAPVYGLGLYVLHGRRNTDP